MTRAERNAWAEFVVAQLPKVLKADDLVSIYCGEEYIAPLRRNIAQLGCRLMEPLFRLSFGKRLQCLQKINDEAALHTTHRKFYRIMQVLYEAQQGGRRIKNARVRCHGQSEEFNSVTEDQRATIRNRMPRITRVGTHAVSLALVRASGIE